MKSKLVLLAAGSLLAIAGPVLAHHSFAAEYDGTQKVSLKGSIVKVEWMNPHIWIYLDAKDDSGEGGPPNSLTRSGWTKDALKTGDEVTIEGFRAKDGTNTCNSRTVVLPNGQKVFSGTAEDGAPGTALPAARSNKSPATEDPRTLSRWNECSGEREFFFCSDSCTGKALGTLRANAH
ncbi:MAG: DUF6152 family protein [Bryobacteraceae bacterium]